MTFTELPTIILGIITMVLIHQVYRQRVIINFMALAMDQQSENIELMCRKHNELAYGVEALEERLDEAAD